VRAKTYAAAAKQIGSDNEEMLEALEGILEG
jgi:hypothetical protein